MQNASPRPGLLLGLMRARARGTSFGRSVQPRPPNSGGDGGPTYLCGGGFLPSRKCLGAPSPLTPLNGYTFTLLRRHPCRHGRSSIRLQAIHMHHYEWLVSFLAHDDPSSIQYFGDEHWAEPRELQLRSPRSFQRYVVNPYQLSSLIFPPLDFTVVVMFLMQRCPLQPRTGVPVRCSDPPWSAVTYSLTVVSSSSGPRGVPYMAWTGSLVCRPSIIMLGVTPVLACGVAR